MWARKAGILQSNKICYALRAYFLEDLRAKAELGGITQRITDSQSNDTTQEF